MISSAIDFSTLSNIVEINRVSRIKNTAVCFGEQRQSRTLPLTMGVSIFISHSSFMHRKKDFPPVFKPMVNATPARALFFFLIEI